MPPNPEPTYLATLPAELSAVIRIALKAGALCHGYFKAWHEGDHDSPLAVELKDGDEPVTLADRKTNELCVSGLRAAFPDDAILSEELPDDGSRHHAARVWLVDPIDGTKDFIAGRPGFAVMIGLLQGGKPTLGVVYQPAEQRLWFASSGLGAYVVLGDAPPVRMHTTATAELTAARMVSSASHPEPMVAQVKERAGIVHDQQIGSVGIKLALIASGAADLYINPAGKCKLWDTGAPECILHEAGGQLSDFVGQPLRYTDQNLGHDRGLCASNGALHPLALQQLRPFADSILRRSASKPHNP